ncbi:MAG: type 4a pilus biogenesis protein PilO [Actinomycetota bacterium]|nr:type 4a pilus biogenesis protein PilO [Actinomycetota bacterium]
MRKNVPLVVVAAALAPVVAALAAYLVVVRPMRAESGRLGKELEIWQARPDTRARATPTSVQIRVADVLRLAKAMPDREDMADSIVELNWFATTSGGRITGIEPQPEAAADGYRVVPIKLTFKGNYYELTDFIFRLRNLVRVVDGRLDTTGSLYTIDGIDLHESANRFPEIETVLTVSTYVYGAGPAGSDTEAGAPTSATTPAPSPTGSSGKAETSGTAPVGTTSAVPSSATQGGP